MTTKDKTDMQKTNLRNLIKTGAFRFIDADTPWFPYTSGQVGPYFVQSISIENDGSTYAHAIESMVRLVRAEVGSFDVITGGETRDWDFSNPVAVMMQMPHGKIYKDGRLLGADVNRKRVLHVADLNNEGTSLRDYWKPIVEKNKGTLIAFVSFVDRLEDGYHLFQKMQLPSYSVVPLDDLAWDVMLAEGNISARLHEQLIARMKDRRRWAINALLENPSYFKRFYAGETNHAKVTRIMQTYPEIAGRLKEIVESHAY